MADRATLGRPARAEPVDKSPDAFRTISEVAVDLDLPQHVLRFWETRFVQIRPLKRGGGRRYYRPDDVDLLKGIRHLLYGEGYTIRGVQRILKEQGVRFVMNVWRDGAPQPPPSGAEGMARHDEPLESEYDDESDQDVAELPPDDAYSPYAPHHLSPVTPPRDADEADFAVPMVRPEPAHGHGREEPRLDHPRSTAEADGAAVLAQRFAPRFAEAETKEETPVRPAAVLSRATPRPIEPRQVASGEIPAVVPGILTEPPAAPEPVAVGRTTPVAAPEPRETPRPGLGQFFDRLRPGREPEPAAAPRTVQALSRDEIRRLQSTLFELLECKRLLDQVR